MNRNLLKRFYLVVYMSKCCNIDINIPVNVEPIKYISYNDITEQDFQDCLNDVLKSTTITKMEFNAKKSSYNNFIEIEENNICEKRHSVNDASTTQNDYDNHEEVLRTNSKIANDLDVNVRDNDDIQHLPLVSEITKKRKIDDIQNYNAFLSEGTSHDSSASKSIKNKNAYQSYILERLNTNSINLPRLSNLEPSLAIYDDLINTNNVDTIVKPEISTLSEAWEDCNSVEINKITKRKRPRKTTCKVATRSSDRQKILKLNNKIKKLEFEGNKSDISGKFNDFMESLNQKEVDLYCKEIFEYETVEATDNNIFLKQGDINLKGFKSYNTKSNNSLLPCTLPSNQSAMKKGNLNKNTTQLRLERKNIFFEQFSININDKYKARNIVESFLIKELNINKSDIKKTSLIKKINKLVDGNDECNKIRFNMDNIVTKGKFDFTNICVLPADTIIHTKLDINNEFERCIKYIRETNDSQEKYQLFIDTIKNTLLCKNPVLKIYILKAEFYNLQLFMPEIHFYIVWKLKNIKTETSDTLTIDYNLTTEINFIMNLFSTYSELNYERDIEKRKTIMSKLNHCILNYRKSVLLCLSEYHYASVTRVLYYLAIIKWNLLSEKPYSIIFILAFSENINLLDKHFRIDCNQDELKARAKLYLMPYLKGIKNKNCTIQILDDAIQLLQQSKFDQIKQNKKHVFVFSFKVSCIAVTFSEEEKVFEIQLLWDSQLLYLYQKMAYATICG